VTITGFEKFYFKIDQKIKILKKVQKKIYLIRKILLFFPKFLVKMALKILVGNANDNYIDITIGTNDLDNYPKI
jgi:hypothetical protein